MSEGIVGGGGWGTEVGVGPPTIDANVVVLRICFGLNKLKLPPTAL